MPSPYFFADLTDFQNTITNSSLGDIVRITPAFFFQHDIEDPELVTELLLAFVLNTKRIDLYQSPQKKLSKKEMNFFIECVKRRIKSEPVQYIVGTEFFFGLELKVTNDVLIPRPETELLIEVMLDVLKQPTRIMDIGTGSGAIAIALAKNISSINVIAVDISSKAISIARENAVTHNMHSRIEFICKDIFDKDFAHDLPLFDAIVSNPPYIPYDEKETLQKEVRNYEPEVALFTSSGLEHYEKIILESQKLLRKDGMIFFEIHCDKKNDVEELLCKASFENITTHKDLEKHDRVVMATKK